MLASFGGNPILACIVPVAVVLTLGQAGVNAAEPQATGNGDPEAAGLFASGMRLIDQGDYQKGVLELEKVYTLHPDPMVLYNLGFAYAALGQPALSADRFEKFLAMTPDDQSVLRVRATAKLADQNKHLATLSLESDAPGELTLDEVRVDKLPIRRRVAAGTHVVAFKLPSASAPSVWHVDLHEGDDLRLFLVRAATPSPAAEAKPSAPSRSAVKDERPSPTPIDSIDGRNRSAWPPTARVTGVLAGVLAAVSGGLLIWNTGRYFEWRRSRDSAAVDVTSNPAAFAEERESLNQRLANIQTMDKVVLGLAAAAAASAVATRILLWPRGHGIGLSPTAGGIAAVARWQF